MSTMNFIVISCVLAVVAARPDSYQVPASGSGGLRAGGSSGAAEVVPILRDDRVGPEGGSYSFDIETGDGIVRSESGAPLSIEGNPTGQQGSISFVFPTGEQYEMKFVANENGFQPESPFLPVAPEFPHPIPDFVLQQIEKAAREDAEAAKSGGSANGGGIVPAPSYGYTAPGK